MRREGGKWPHSNPPLSSSSSSSPLLPYKGPPCRRHASNLLLPPPPPFSPSSAIRALLAMAEPVLAALRDERPFDAAAAKAALRLRRGAVLPALEANMRILAAACGERRDTPLRVRVHARLLQALPAGSAKARAVAAECWLRFLELPHVRSPLPFPSLLRLHLLSAALFSIFEMDRVRGQRWKQRANGVFKYVSRLSLARCSLLLSFFVSLYLSFFLFLGLGLSLQFTCLLTLHICPLFLSSSLSCAPSFLTTSDLSFFSSQYHMSPSPSLHLCILVTFHSLLFHFSFLCLSMPLSKLACFVDVQAVAAADGKASNNDDDKHDNGGGGNDENSDNVLDQASSQCGPPSPATLRQWHACT